MNRYVIIIGTEHHNTLSMIRDFGQNNVPVVLITYGLANTYISSSKYIIQSYHLESVTQVVSRLNKVICSSSFKPVVIACTDEAAALMDQNYDELKDKCFFFNAGEKGRLSYYMSKRVQSDLALQSGFLVPDMVEGVPSKISVKTIHYPCVVKPKESIHGGKNIFVCQSDQEMTVALERFDPHYEVLVQDFIAKDFEIVILGMSINGNHTVPGYVKKHRDYKGGTTYSTTYDKSEIPESVLVSCYKMLSAINYTGLWGIECIVRDNLFFFVELNLRNDATTYSITKAGVDLPLMFYNYCYKNTNGELNKIRQIDSMVEFSDFIFVLKMRVSLFKWLRQYYKCECLYYKAEDDITPYIIQCKNYRRFLRRSIFHF